MKSLKILLIVSVILVIVSCSPVLAALNSIPAGGTAYIGEQGLDITATGAKSGSTLAWFSGSSNIATGAPAATVTVDDASNFYIAPSLFTGKTGQWYLFPVKTPATPAFYVDDPSLAIRIFDETSQFEVSGTVTWVPKGDAVSFRIDNNLYKMTGRSGVSGAPVTIRVRSPDGTEYSQLSGNNLNDIPVSSASYSTGPIWSTGAYQSGTYTIWAECNANGMKDNYPVVTKTISTETPMLLQSVNPLITSSVTQTGTKPPAPIVTNTEPGTSLPTRLTTTVPATITPLETTVSITPLPTSQPVTTRPPPVATTTPGPGILLVITGVLVALLVIWRKDAG